MKKFIGVLCALTVLGLGAACEPAADTDAPSSGSQKENGGDKGGDKPADTADNSSKGKGAITWGNWEVVGKLQVTKEDFTGDYAVVTRVKNTGDDPDDGFFTVTILKGTNILGTADCSTSTVNPGATGTADCISTDKYQDGWTEVTIENSF